MRVGVLISARLGSARLCDKHLLEIGTRPALVHLLTRVEREFAGEIESGHVVAAIASGDRGRNYLLGELVAGTSVGIFYGDDENIPRRHLQAAERYDLDAVISVDGDDIFCAPEAMRAVFRQLSARSNVVKVSGLPLGMNAWGYTRHALAAALTREPHGLLETGWGRIFNGMPSEEIVLECPRAMQVRATLDYPEDLRFFDSCVRTIEKWSELPAPELVDRIVSCGLHEINSVVNDKYWKNFAMAMSIEKSKGEDPRIEEDVGLDFGRRLHSVIPGGAHTYSRGDDQYPENAPRILERGSGVHVWTPGGKRFLDYGLALRAVSIGYAEPSISAAAIRGIEQGNSLTRASVIELEAAERLVTMVDSVDMVKFTKNGSTATSAAVKLARAYTGRDLIARCAQHPFFSFDDWFIGSTPITKGIPANVIEQTKSFAYNDIDSLRSLIGRHPGEIACVILEPASTACPATGDGQEDCCGQACCERYGTGQPNYLQLVEALCRENGIVFILDETITGFRWHMKGAQHVYGVTPDLSTFGKAMANGFSVAAVAGKREIMSLGSTDRSGQERLFLLSTTHGAEMSGLSAFMATMDFLENHNVIAHLWNYGAELISVFNRVAAEHGIQKYMKAAGPAANPYYATVDVDGAPWFELRTLFSQEMIRQSVLMPWMAIAYRHGEVEMRQTEAALQRAMEVCAKGVKEGIEKYLSGPAIKPVFRRYN